ncbi:MAG TPA: hypothetical protein VGK17_09145 [Propionicimonas sp.]|jgi:lambda repressor-like predicted transcriptional regulator
MAARTVAEDMTRLNLHVKARLRQEGITQQQVAERVGEHLSTFRDHLRPNGGVLTLVEYFAIAEMLGIGPDELWPPEDEA